MQIKKEILFFYVLILGSAAVIIAAEKPALQQQVRPASIKCSKAPGPKPSASPFNIITESILRYRA